MGALRAELMDGSSGRARAVQVAVLPDRLLIHSEDGSELEAWGLAELQVDPLPGGVLHLTHPAHPGALLSSSDTELREFLVSAGATPRSPATRRLLLRGLFYGATIAGAVALFLALLPAVSAGIARRVPLSIEEQLAFPVHSLLENRYCRSAESRRALVALADSLRLEDDPGFAGARVEIVDFAMVNAFTFPGGSIVVTRGLIDDAQRPEELAGVLAHELEHVARRHVMAQVVRNLHHGMATHGGRLRGADGHRSVHDLGDRLAAFFARGGEGGRRGRNPPAAARKSLEPRLVGFLRPDRAEHRRGPRMAFHASRKRCPEKSAAGLRRRRSGPVGRGAPAPGLASDQGGVQRPPERRAE